MNVCGHLNIYKTEVVLHLIMQVQFEARQIILGCGNRFLLMRTSQFQSWCSNAAAELTGSELVFADSLSSFTSRFSLLEFICFQLYWF